MVYPVIEWIECGISHGIIINDMGFLISFLDISSGEISMSIWLWSICWISHGIVGESCHESGNIWAYPGWWFGTFFNFPYIGNDHPNWLSYFSEGLKPPTSINIMFFHLSLDWICPAKNNKELDFRCLGWTTLKGSPVKQTSRLLSDLKYGSSWCVRKARSARYWPVGWPNNGKGWSHTLATP